jgi:hypothetical protein
MLANKFITQKSVSRWVFILVSLVVGCSSGGPTRLFEGFESYQSPGLVRGLLAKVVNENQWEEHSKNFDPVPPDKRPPYKFLTMSGPYQSLGISGQLELTFYNSRLMEVRFTTTKGSEYLDLLRAHSKVPRKATEEIVLDRHTKFRFDTNSDGTVRFSWFDAKLWSEWLKWAYAYG